MTSERTADEADRASNLEEIARSTAIARAAQPMDPGVAGECDGCGEHFDRLVRGLCGFCRDGRR